MQRQSLGSPASKLHANGVVIIKEDAHVSPSSAAELSQKPFSNDDEDGEENKLQKKLHKAAPSRAEKFIHLIPVITLFCILILFLCSHDPSQTELAGFKRLSKPIDSTNIDKIQRVLEIEKGEVLGIRSMRNLQEVDKEIPKHRLNRKIGNF